MSEELVKDAMVSEPLSLEVGASSQAAGEALARPEVRAVFVCDDGKLVGVVTRKTLVREVVATGRDPRTTTLGEIAEPPNATIDASAVLADAFAYLEEHDYERVPVVDAGKLVGVLSRAVVQRRLAEDEEVAETEGVGHQRGDAEGRVHGEQRRQRVAAPPPNVVVGEPSLVVELLVCVTDGQFGLDDPGAHRAEHLPELGGRPDASERPRAGADHGDGLVAKRVCRERA